MMSRADNSNMFIFSSRLNTYRSMNEESIKLVQKSYLNNMIRALEYHCLTLQYGSKYDLVSIFRIVAIWFDNEPSYNEIREFAKVSIEASGLVV